MDRRQRIISVLTEALKPTRLEVEEESHKHAGHNPDAANGGTHYKIVAVSAKFEGMNKVTRHRIIYQLVDREFKNGLHALAIEALSPLENKGN